MVSPLPTEYSGQQETSNADASSTFPSRVSTVVASTVGHAAISNCGAVVGVFASGLHVIDISSLIGILTRSRARHFNGELRYGALRRLRSVRVPVRERHG